VRNVPARRSRREGLDLALASFSAFLAGEPIPAVDPKDLRGLWALKHKLVAEFAQNPKGDVATPAPSIDVALLAGACAPGANVLAVWVRSTLLDLAVSQGLLAPWQQATLLDHAVFDLAATLPIPRLDRFDPDDFLQRLGHRRS
jgi:hypothetical protein